MYSSVLRLHNYKFDFGKCVQKARFQLFECSRLSQIIARPRGRAGINISMFWGRPHMIVKSLGFIRFILTQYDSTMSSGPVISGFEVLRLVNCLAMSAFRFAQGDREVSPTKVHVRTRRTWGA